MSATHPWDEWISGRKMRKIKLVEVVELDGGGEENGNENHDADADDENDEDDESCF